MATSGPGAIHLMNGLYDAKLDHAPVVAIVGQQARMALGSNFQQEVDLTTLFKDVASEYVQVCMAPEQAAHLIDRAIRIAKATRSVTCVIVPNDIQEAEYSEPPRAHGAVPSSVGFLRAGDPSARRGPAAGRRRAQRGREGGDAGRPGRDRRRARGGRGRRAARRRRRQGAQRPRRACPTTCRS